MCINTQFGRPRRTTQVVTKLSKTFFQPLSQHTNPNTRLFTVRLDTAIRPLFGHDYSAVICIHRLGYQHMHRHKSTIQIAFFQWHRRALAISYTGISNHIDKYSPTGTILVNIYEHWRIWSARETQACSSTLTCSGWWLNRSAHGWQDLNTFCNEHTDFTHEHQISIETYWITWEYSRLI